MLKIVKNRFVLVRDFRKDLKLERIAKRSIKTSLTYYYMKKNKGRKHLLNYYKNKSDSRTHNIFQAFLKPALGHLILQIS